MTNKPYGRLRDKSRAETVVTARRIDVNDGRKEAIDYLVAEGMGGWEGNNHWSAHRILDYETFKYIDCIPKEHPLWREQRQLEDQAINRRAEARKHRPVLMGRSGGKCEWCGKAVAGRNATVDHIDPNAGNEPDNLALLCRPCNARKSRGSLDRLERIDEASRNRDEFFSLMSCPCHHYGCFPDCTGCHMCGHDETTLPPHLICELGIGCATPSQCRSAQSCQRTPEQIAKLEVDLYAPPHA